jgi:divinyl protochlorophyllide a 8-vinyl-reductase
MAQVALDPRRVLGGHAAPEGSRGRIGPNAILRVAEVLPPRLGSRATAELFEAAGLGEHLRHPPQTLVDEEDVRRLHAVLRERLGGPAAREVARAAGAATADYLLAHRIPRPLQSVLRRLPARWAARVLLAAITRNAWTFVGSGRFAASAGSGTRPVTLEIRANPLCRDLQADEPACDYYAATFERLFAQLVHPHARAREVACEACGGDACRFEIRW